MMPPSKELIGKLSKLEAVERRWLWAVFSSIILGAILVALTLLHLDFAVLASREPVRIPPTQFLTVILGSIIILISNTSVLIEYFAFELRVERAVVIKKRRRSRPGDEEEQGESADE